METMTLKIGQIVKSKIGLLYIVQEIENNSYGEGPCHLIYKIKRMGTDSTRPLCSCEVSNFEILGHNIETAQILYGNEG